MAILVLTWWLYTPGLSGGFQFDDFGNLPALGASGPVDTWATFWRYISSGTADPTGRPLALLRFLLDAHNWPADPRPFLRTNVLLHLINGALLALLLRCLGRLLLAPRLHDAYTDGDNTATRIDLAAVLGAAFWLLHPLLVSTTLYIVQREAMLPATFTLLGLLLWLHGRRQMHRNRLLAGACWIVLGLGGCTLLGVLSKANGILLPALALVIEYSVLRTAKSSRTQRSGKAYHQLMLLLAWLPTAVVASYLVYTGWRGFGHTLGSLRPWTLPQRLLTEPRVVMDYLQLLWVPRPFTPGLFNDHFHASTSLLSPLSTLPALLAVLGIIFAACLLRKRWPATAMAALFYFVGLSLESTTIPLELYFEHRNYLPAMLMFWPLALWLCGIRQQRSANPRAAASTKSNGFPLWAKPALAIVLLLGLSMMTHARAALWGNTQTQSLLWAKLNPDSPRAQANAAATEMRHGHPERAVIRLQPLLEREPDQVQLALNLFDAQCIMGHVDAATLEATATALRSTRNPGALLLHWFNQAMASSAHPSCPQANLSTIQQLLDAARQNPKLLSIAGRRQDMDFLDGRLALLHGHADAALTDFNRGLDQNVRASVALKQAAWLGSHGYAQRGLAHLDHYQSIAAQAIRPTWSMTSLHAWVLHRQHYWAKEIDYLRATLRADAAASTLDHAT
ncbi:MAG: hypothetical protein L0H70_03710, partial [Xanthomonadales bacterium]|nr:hypothetical protein [Xanthomonadales bacterium]